MYHSNNHVSLFSSVIELSAKYYERNFEPRVGSALFFLRFKIFCSYFLFSFGRKEPSPWRKVIVKGKIFYWVQILFFSWFNENLMLLWKWLSLGTKSVQLQRDLIRLFNLITTNFSWNYFPTKLWTLEICLKH